ncbi:DUF2945 domain-containing protein [Frondihabitans australicus]|uniref:Hypervirulence associated protein TUDOR domain-containing protein n=1 Tax=Frondihabitans australicus TaxID=386892 RepID=A0A495IGJ4_9MICO|nr:DUF2945 domain-containing protein [Frondihabitans australicus]RKR74869.1 hypothetical protein C8E83_2002 [Frondihabitans australicus]
MSTEKNIRVHDRVSWRSSQGRVRGVVVERRNTDSEFDGQAFTATREDPVFIVESEKTAARAAHKGTALRKLASKSR